MRLDTGLWIIQDIYQRGFYSQKIFLRIKRILFRTWYSKVKTNFFRQLVQNMKIHFPAEISILSSHFPTSLSNSRYIWSVSRFQEKEKKGEMITKNDNIK